MELKWLLDDDLCATSGFAGETAGFDLFEANDTVFFSMNRVVLAHVGTRAGLLGFADLSDDNTTSFDLLATKKLDAKALAG